MISRLVALIVLVTVSLWSTGCGSCCRMTTRSSARPCCPPAVVPACPPGPAAMPAPPAVSGFPPVASIPTSFAP